MDKVRSILSSAGRRLWINDFLHVLVVALAAAMGVLVIARVVERVFSLERFMGPWWQWMFLGAGLLAAVVAVVWALVVKRSSLRVAMEVDDRAMLKESLSTALAVEKQAQTDPWSRAVLETAAQDAARVKVPFVVPVQAPRFWAAPLGGIIALLLVWYAVPSLDVLGRAKVRNDKEKKLTEVAIIRNETNDAKEKVLKALAKTNPELLKDPSNANEMEAKKPIENDPDAIRRAALKEMTDLSSKIEEAKQGEKGAQSEAMKKVMEKLKQPGPGPMDQFSKNLSKGDFQGAKEALDEMSKKLADDSMPAEQKEQVQKQMENLSKQLEDLAKDQGELVKQLQKQGLDKKSAEELAKKASDPASLQQAMEQMKQLSPEQQKEMMKMAQACMKAGGQCGEMSKALSKAAQGMSQQGLQQQGSQGMSDLAQQLSEMEMMQSDMENLDAALKETKSQMSKLGADMGKSGKNGGDQTGSAEGGGLGQWRAGNENKMGRGQGGGGRGDDPNGIGDAPADFEFEKTKAKVQNNGGPIISSRLVYGDQIKGEATREFAEIVKQGEESLAEGLETQRVPKEMESAVKNYFGRLKTKAQQAQPGAAAKQPVEVPAPSPAPAPGK